MQKLLYVHQLYVKTVKICWYIYMILSSTNLFACCYVKNLANLDVLCIQTNVAICRFQNKYNKLVIALRAVQF